MSIIFLDIDGVVRPYSGGMEFDPGCMRCLHKIVTSTQSRIVLSSSWRITNSGVRLVNLALKRFGMEPVISVTPDYPDRFRSEEILSWLANNEKKYLLKNWIAIDDIDLAFGTPAMNGHFVHTESNTGLTEALAQLGINLLNGTDRSTAVIAVENDGAVVPPEAMSSQKVIAKLRPKLTTDGQKMKNHDAGSGVQHNSNIAPSVTQLRSRLRALSVPSHKGKFDQMERISTNPPPPTLPRLGNSNANTSAVGRTSRR